LTRITQIGYFISPYFVGVIGALIGGGFARYFAIPKPYYYFLIVGVSGIFYELTERYYKNRK
jgi:hypothetical protein